MKKHFDTLVEAIQALRNEGYTEDFNLEAESIVASHSKTAIKPNEFEVDNYYRFEGESNPADSSILYAITSEKHNCKGVLVNAYGIYAEEIVTEMMEKLTIHPEVRIEDE